MSVDNFLELIKEYEKDYEIFCFNKDSIKLYKNFSLLEIRCDSCGKYDHYINMCPLLNLRANLINRVNIRVACFNYQPRNIVNKRRKKKKTNALYSKKDYEEKFEMRLLNLTDKMIFNLRSII